MAVPETTPTSKYLKERPSPTTAPPLDDRMAKAKRWTVWTIRKAEGGRKPSKVPVAKPTDESTWNYYHAARACLSDPKIAGLGFEMFGRPGVVGVDIDNCLDESGTRTPLAAEFLLMLEAAGSKYHVEISPSGKGLRIFAAETDLPFHDFTNNDTGVEVYSGESGRFLAFTGQMIPGFGQGPFSPLSAGAVAFLAKHALKMKDGKKRADVEPAPDRPELSQRDDWEKLHPGALTRLAKEHRTFLKEGTLGKKYASASEQLFAIEMALLKHLKPAQAYQVLISAPGSWHTAMEHRESIVEKALDFVWNDLQRARAGHEDFEQDRQNTASVWADCQILTEVVDDTVRAKFVQLNVTNAFTLHREWVDRLGWNIFDGRVTVDRKDVTIRQLHELSAWVTDFLRWPMEPRRDQFEESLTEAAKTRPWNPVEEELRGLVWDGRERTKKFTEAVVKEPTKLDEQILRKWLVGYVARGIKPGCKLDTMLCLTGVEGAYKTSFARLMAGGAERFNDTPTFESDKDSAMARGGMRVVEVGEGAAARRADRFALKNDLSKTFDHFRPPWGRTVERRDRGFVYILTSNPDDFLRSDQDGLRRFWPVKVRDEIDLKWIEANHGQLLAEAVAAFDAGEEWWWDRASTPPELLERVGMAVQEDPLDGAVASLLDDEENRRKEWLTLAMVQFQLEAKVGKNLDRGTMQKVIDLLHKHGWINEQRRMGGSKARWWSHAKLKEPLEKTEEIGKVIKFPSPAGGDPCPAPSLPRPTQGGTDLLE
jgi:predicted P-loop ATPase